MSEPIIIPSPLSETAATHEHTCAFCKETFRCTEDKCDINKVAKINGKGPYCALCFHMMFAVRYARHRRWKQKSVQSLLAKVWSYESNSTRD